MVGEDGLDDDPELAGLVDSGVVDEAGVEDPELPGVVEPVVGEDGLGDSELAGVVVPVVGEAGVEEPELAGVVDSEVGEAEVEEDPELTPAVELELVGELVGVVEVDVVDVDEGVGAGPGAQVRRMSFILAAYESSTKSFLSESVASQTMMPPKVSGYRPMYSSTMG